MSNKFLEFLTSIVNSGDWQYSDGESMTEDAREFLISHGYEVKSSTLFEKQPIEVNSGPVWLKIAPERLDSSDRTVFISIQSGPLNFSGIVTDADLLSLARLRPIGMEATFHVAQCVKRVKNMKPYGNDSIILDADTLGLLKVEK